MNERHSEWTRIFGFDRQWEYPQFFKTMNGRNYENRGGKYNTIVYVGNRDAMTCSKICPSVALVLQGIEFASDLHILPIKEPDIILGIP